MRKITSVVVLIVLVASALPFMSVAASPAAQFAGCADEVGEEFGARYVLTSLNGLTFRVTAVGLGEFDPQITVIDQEGAVIACNDDSDDAALYAAVLPSVEVVASEGSSQVSVTVPGDQGRFDYEIIISSADGTAGEFLMFYEGAEVFGSDNIDEFKVFTNQGQVDAEVPLVVYAANLKRPELAIDPEITFAYGEDLVQTCSKSSADSLCNGEHEDLTGFTVTTDDIELYELNGDDVMLAYQAGGDPSEFLVSVGSYQAASFGAYALMIHSGVGAAVSAEG